MADKETFFHTSDWGGFQPGDTLNIQKRVSFISDGAKKFMQPLVSQEKVDLQKQQKESEAKEAEVYEEIKKLCKEWESLASQTLLLRRAIEYLDMQPVEHTGNEWKEAKDGTWEISNLVYKMQFKTSKGKKPGETFLKWGIVYNIPEQPASFHYQYNRYGNPWGADIFVVKPEKRSYASLESAQKFIQARFDEYAAFFAELSPPIPRECQKMFSVNGYLLPGYKVASAAKTIDQSVDTLLDFLENANTTPEALTAEAPAPETVIPEPAVKEAPPAASPTKAALHENPAAPPKRKPVRQSVKKSVRKKKKADLER